MGFYVEDRSKRSAVKGYRSPEFIKDMKYLVKNKEDDLLVDRKIRFNEYMEDIEETISILLNIDKKKKTFINWKLDLLKGLESLMKSLKKDIALSDEFIGNIKDYYERTLKL